MDYGSYLKKEFGNPNVQSKHHTKQSTFNGSDRQIRGAIVRALTLKPYTRSALLAELSPYEDIKVDIQVESLIREGMVVKLKNKKYTLPC
jgi:A/G-specific adenine glycosylase